jgi:ABC-type transporter Mla subunit MlaD
MKGDAKYWRLGLFVLAAIAVVVAGVILLSSGVFSGGTSLTLETYVAGSVEGVRKGSEVHYQGIPVGTVEDVSLTADVYQTQLPFDQRRPYVLVRFSVGTQAFGNLSRQAAHQLFQDWIARGLHITREPRGLSGNSYLQMQFLAAAQAETTLAFDWTPRYLYVPEAPGLSGDLSHVLQEAHAALQQIAGLDLAHAGRKLESVLQAALQAAHDLQALLGDPRLKTIVADIARSAAALDSLVAASGPRVTATTENLQQMSQRLDAATADLPATVADLTRALDQVSLLLSWQQGDIAGAIRNLERAAESLRFLLEQVRQNPGGLLFGEPPPHVKP